jgi:regulator of cell morphogenesis and NO signaling
MSDLIAYSQERFHGPLRDELPRLGQMMAKVVSRHGQRLPETLLPLQQTLAALHVDLLHHMQKEDEILFPAIQEIESGRLGGHAAWIEQPIEIMEDEHEQAGAALARIRDLTSGYTPPADACPTFRGLYYGLAELEREMHVHVHLENNILFPRAAHLSRVR